MAHNHIACSEKSSAPGFCGLGDSWGTALQDASRLMCLQRLRRSVSAGEATARSFLGKSPQPAFAAYPRSAPVFHGPADSDWPIPSPAKFRQACRKERGIGLAKGTVLALISPTNVAKQYGVSPELLRQWRRRGVGPEYFQFTARTISYCDDYLRHWFNDPRNTDLLGEHPAVSVDTSCQDGRVRHGRPRSGR